MREKERKCSFGESRADLRIISSGKNLGEAVENSFSCFFLYVFDESKINETGDCNEFQFEVEHTNLEDIVHDVYTEVIYLIYVKELIVKTIFVNMGEKVTVFAKTIIVDNFAEYLRGEIKAITYHNLNIREDGDNVVMDVTFDI